MKIELELTANELARYLHDNQHTFSEILHTVGKRLQKGFRAAREEANQRRRTTVVRNTRCLHESRGMWVCIGRKGHKGKHTFLRGTKWSVR